VKAFSIAVGFHSAEGRREGVAGALSKVEWAELPSLREPRIRGLPKTCQALQIWKTHQTTTKQTEISVEKSLPVNSTQLSTIEI
jgi:hypothetical protein